jgi:hypothetical protein
VYIIFSSMTKENSISEENVTAFPEAANAVFDIIQDQIFTQQFSSETEAELDQLFFKTLLSEQDFDRKARVDFIFMYINLKKLLVTVTKKQIPQTITQINVDISMYF